jgi:hypothetical protein
MYATEQFRRGCDVEPPRRKSLLEQINSIYAENWVVSSPHWSESHSPFRDDLGMMLIWQESVLCAYTIYQRFKIGERPVIYRSATVIKPAHQRRGLYHRLNEFAVSDETVEAVGQDAAFMAWRTRNPIVWYTLSGLCGRVAPSLNGGTENADDLVEIASELCAQLYPRQTLQLPSLIMPDVYGHLTYRHEPTMSSQPRLNAWFSSNLNTTRDSVFSVGELRPRNRRFLPQE